jgi:hypothetical protein
MPREYREVERRRGFEHLTGALLDWLFREFVLSGEFGEARGALYATMIARVNTEENREIMHIFFGPALMAFVERIGREADADVRDWIVKKRRRGNPWSPRR